MSTVTLEEVWALFKETDRKFKETDLKFQETDRMLKEHAAQLKEHAIQLKETERLLNEQTGKLGNETARMSKEHAAQLKETERLFNKQMGKLSNRLGDFVEEMVKPSVIKVFRERGIEVHVVTQRVQANNPELDLAMEIDLLAINKNVCILIEVKSHLSIDDVNEHLERMQKFKPLFPNYADSQVYGAVAGMVIPDDVAKYAYRKGFFVMAQTGEMMGILNKTNFQPMAW
jgi:DNA-binding transcriptional MerR regulator